MNDKIGIEATVTNCERCMGTHKAFFFPLKIQDEYATHWGFCPETKEPLIVTDNPQGAFGTLDGNAN